MDQNEIIFKVEGVDGYVLSENVKKELEEHINNNEEFKRKVHKKIIENWNSAMLGIRIKEKGD